MAQIDLPRPLDSYFTFAELPSNRQGRRFTITFTYFEGQRLDRLQWWWQVSSAQERVGGDAGIDAQRRQAVERFRLHIERWLDTSQKRLFDGEPFPRLEAMGAGAGEPAPAVTTTPAAGDATIVPWPIEKVANA